MKKMITIVLSTVCMLALLVGCSGQKSKLANMETEQGEGYRAILWEERTYVPYCAVSPSERGKQLGIVDGDNRDKVYEHRNYPSDEWIINFMNSDSSMLYREITVTDIPDGLTSEYEWNNSTRQVQIQEENKTDDLPEIKTASRIDEQYAELSFEDAANDEETLPDAFQALISGDVAFVEDSRIANELKDMILPHGNLEYAVLDLDGDNNSELLIQKIDEPSSYNAVFHYDGKKLVCWNHDMMEMSCRDFPLEDGTMVRQYDYGGTQNYTLFRYCANGEREEIAHLFVRNELIPEDSAEPCPYYEIDGESVDEKTFNAALEEKIYEKMLDRDAWNCF